MLKKILSFYTRYFAIWVVVFGAVAYFWPGAFIELEKPTSLLIMKPMCFVKDGNFICME